MIIPHNAFCIFTKNKHCIIHKVTQLKITDGSGNYRIGGTLSPTVKLKLEGDRTFITEVHGYAEIRSQREWNN